jgi:hypothetical protein
MRLIAALFTAALLISCGLSQTQSEQSLAGNGDEVRHRLAVQDAEAILQGMAQARARAEQMARTAP